MRLVRADRRLPTRLTVTLDCTARVAHLIEAVCALAGIPQAAYERGVSLLAAYR